MYLVEAERREEIGGTEASSACPSQRWSDFPFSSLSHHGGACCEIAREWVRAMDASQLAGADSASGPRWIRASYQWGPSPWPMHWCELVERKTIDCGAHAALAHEAFRARGLTAFRAQFVQTYNADSLSQWRRKWADEQVSDHWIGEDVIYHEGNALLVGERELKLWDSSAGWWLNPRQRGGYGSLAAVRIFAAVERCDVATFSWGGMPIVADSWVRVDAAARQPRDGLLLRS